MQIRALAAGCGCVCLLSLTASLVISTASNSATSNGQPRLGVGAVVTANPAATTAAVKMLELGGSTADATIAAQMALGVVEPQSSGLGGGAIVLYRESGKGPIRAFDGLARSPTSYDRRIASANGFSHGGASVGIPGALRVLELLHARYGTLPWATLFGPAIELAENGFTVSPYLARSLASATKAGFVLPTWLRDSAGNPVAAGTIIKNPKLAATMREIAQKGSIALYVDMAPAISSAVRNAKLPGAVTSEDLAAYSAVERAPLCTIYHAIDLCVFPPPSYGGIAVLEHLLIFDRLHPRTPNFLSAESVHAFIEAGRIAEADRLDVVGDPDSGATPITPLLSPDYLEQRVNLVSTEKAMANPVVSGTPDGLVRPVCASTAKPKPPSTSQLAIVDGKGAAVSMTTTINVNFGAWIEVNGFFLNDAMTNFAFERDAPCPANRGAPNKRPETAMVPVIGTNAEGNAVLIGGSAGGGEIVDYVAQALVQIIYGASALEALDAGHVSTARSPYPESPGLVELEQGRGIAELTPMIQSLGHTVKVAPLDSGLGFLVWKNDGWSGAADPRRDGNWAIVYCCH